MFICVVANDRYLDKLKVNMVYWLLLESMSIQNNAWMVNIIRIYKINVLNYKRVPSIGILKLEKCWQGLKKAQAKVIICLGGCQWFLVTAY